MLLLDQQEINPQQLLEKLNHPQELFQYCGSVLIEHTEAASRMMVCYDENAGCYLNYQVQGSPAEWLSLADSRLLSTVFAYDEDCYASLGLFLPLKEAVSAIEAFALSGRRSDRITWISADEMPEDGNW